MSEASPAAVTQLLTRSELRALSWAVRRASNNGGGFVRQIAAAQRVLEKLSMGTDSSPDGRSDEKTSLQT